MVIIIYIYVYTYIMLYRSGRLDSSPKAQLESSILLHNIFITVVIIM